LAYAALAALPAVAGSRVVLATAGGSPDWLLGPLRPFGAAALAGPQAGVLYFALLCLALGLYVAVLARARSVRARSLLLAVVVVHGLFLLAPPLLSQDVFSYIAYARMGEVHGLDPYVAAPRAIPGDPVFPFAGSKDIPSVYGPIFTLGSYVLVPLGVAGALWAFKALAAVASLAVVALVWIGASRRAIEPRTAVAAVGLNPAVLVHVVGGAHNEALVVLASTAGLVAWDGGRRAAGTALATAGATLKASALLLVPFLVLGARSRSQRVLDVRSALAAVATIAGAGVVSVIAFGPRALDAFGSLGANQDRTSSFAFPRKTAELLGAIGPGDRMAYQGAVRVAYAAAALAMLVWLMWRTWRGLDPVRAAAWATVAVLVASAWLVPWYVLWLLPLAVLSGGRAPVATAVALTAWTLPIAIPW
jgi:hypothetical protein